MKCEVGLKKVHADPLALGSLRARNPTLNATHASRTLKGLC